MVVDKGGKAKVRGFAGEEGEAKGCTVDMVERVGCRGLGGEKEDENAKEEGFSTILSSWVGWEEIFGFRWEKDQTYLKCLMNRFGDLDYYFNRIV